MFAIAYISRDNLHCILLSLYLYYVLVFFLVPSLIIGYLHFNSLRMLSEKPEGRNGISSSGSIDIPTPRTQGLIVLFGDY